MPQDKPFAAAPDCFKELHRSVDRAGHNQNCLRNSRVELERTDCGRYFNTAPISQAASKYLLANYTTGLNACGYAGEDSVENYSGQLIMTVTAAAFETYCRLCGKKWHDVYQDIFRDDDGRDFRVFLNDQDLPADFFSKLIKANNDERLTDRIKRFIDQNDEINFYAICVGFRNAFSHGRLGSLDGTFALAGKMREIVIRAIDRDCRKQAALIQ